MAGPDTIQLTDDSFDQTVLQSDVPVLVDFGAEWCGPCQALAPTIDAIATEYKGRARVAAVDTETCPQTSAKFGISSIPTVIVFEKGEVVDKFVGLRGEGDYKAALDKCL